MKIITLDPLSYALDEVCDLDALLQIATPNLRLQTILQVLGMHVAEIDNSRVARS